MDKTLTQQSSTKQQQESAGILDDKTSCTSLLKKRQYRQTTISGVVKANTQGKPVRIGYSKDSKNNIEGPENQTQNLTPNPLDKLHQFDASNQNCEPQDLKNYSKRQDQFQNQSVPANSKTLKNTSFDKCDGQDGSDIIHASFQEQIITSTNRNQQGFNEDEESVLDSQEEEVVNQIDEIQVTFGSKEFVSTIRDLIKNLPEPKTIDQKAQIQELIVQELKSIMSTIPDQISQARNVNSIDAAKINLPAQPIKRNAREYAQKNSIPQQSEKNLNQFKTPSQNNIFIEPKSEILELKQKLEIQQQKNDKEKKESQNIINRQGRKIKKLNKMCINYQQEISELSVIINNMSRDLFGDKSRKLQN